MFTRLIYVFCSKDLRKRENSDPVLNYIFQKKENVDLKSIDITIHKDIDAAVTYKTPAEIAFEKRQLQNQARIVFS